MQVQSHCTFSYSSTCTCKMVIKPGYIQECLCMLSLLPTLSLVEVSSEHAWLANAIDATFILVVCLMIFTKRYFHLYMLYVQLCCALSLQRSPCLMNRPDWTISRSIQHQSPSMGTLILVRTWRVYCTLCHWTQASRVKKYIWHVYAIRYSFWNHNISHLLSV